jgi:hypothetical protein
VQNPIKTHYPRREVSRNMPRAGADHRDGSRVDHWITPMIRMIQ